MIEKILSLIEQWKNLFFSYDECICSGLLFPCSSASATTSLNILQLSLYLQVWMHLNFIYLTGQSPEPCVALHGPYENVS